MPHRRAAVSAIYYAGLTLLMLLIVTGTIGDVLPKGFAHKLAEDSEGFTLALLLPLWLQYVRPRLRAAAAGTEAGVTAAAAVAALVVGVVLYRTMTVTSSVKTLNETFLALAVLLPYVQRRRPLPVAVPVTIAGVVLVLMLFAEHLTLVSRLAETLGMLLLVPVTLDLVDRGVLDPHAVTSPRLRWAWYAALLAAPAVVAVAHAADLPGVAGDLAAYYARAQEAFIGVFVLALYLGVGLRLTGAAGPEGASGDGPARRLLRR